MTIYKNCFPRIFMYIRILFHIHHLATLDGFSPGSALRNNYWHCCGQRVHAYGMQGIELDQLFASKCPMVCSLALAPSHNSFRSYY